MRELFQSTLLATTLLLGLPATAEPNPDLSFVKQEPFRKAKQTLDTSAITTTQDARVIGEAITPVMRLLVGLSYATLPAPVDQEILTEQGRTALRQPPLQNRHNRLILGSVGHWKVCGDHTLSFSATYRDLFRKNPWTANFLFKKVEGAWRFDDHVEVGTASCVNS